MLAVLTAMPREAASFAKAINATPVNGGEGLLRGVLGETGVLVSAVGIGAKEIDRVVAELTQDHGVTEIVAMGYAGAADASLNTGDLVLGTDTCLIDESGLTEIHSRDAVAALDAKLLARAESGLSGWGIPYRAGKIGTVARVVTEPRTKREIAERFGIRAVDMETYHVAEAVSRYRLPFLAVRAIVDTAEMQLPQGLDALYDEGRVSVARSLGYVVNHPGELWRLSGLGLKARAADKALNAFIRSYLFVE